MSEDAGWLEIIRNAGAGSVAFDLYRTVDGGMHWLRGPRVQSPRLSPAVPLRCDLCSGNLIVSSGRTAWSTGCWCGIGNGSGFLHVSRDAGRTWRAVAVSPPAHRRPITVATPPAPFDRRHGVLPTVIFGGLASRSNSSRRHFDAYLTHDGGAHWTPTTPVALGPDSTYPVLLSSFPAGWHGLFLN